MDNIILTHSSPQAQALSQNLGFEKTFFIDQNVKILEGDDKKQLVRQIDIAHAKKLLIIYRATSEEMLRFVLEKTKADLITGIETIHPKDHLHYPRGGLDNILCKIAHDTGKIIGFSFSSLLNSPSTSRGKILGRMMFNAQLCQKYKVKTLFSNFSIDSTDMRSKKDLEAFGRVIGL